MNEYFCPDFHTLLLCLHSCGRKILQC